MDNGRWVTISGRRVFIRTNQHPMDAFIKNIKPKEDKKEQYIQLIVDEINNDYEKMDPEDKEWADNFTNYLDVMGYDSSKDFKEDIMFMALKHDNDNYSKGGSKELNFNLYDDGDIELEDGTLYSYRKAVTEAKKRIKYFNKQSYDEEE